MNEVKRMRACIPAAYAGWRLDRALACLFPQHSRSCIQRWIRSGEVRLQTRTAAPDRQLSGGEQVEGWAEVPPRPHWRAEALPLAVIYEDEELLVIDKPVGLVIHPGVGNPSRTLLNGLLHLRPQLGLLPRAGIVHRLDKDTSGLLVVAKTLPAHTSLTGQLRRREVGRRYLAVVEGVPTPPQGSIDLPIGRHPVQRRKMAVVADGKPAVTHYRLLESFHWRALLELRLESGRTHQIRVHLARLRHPVVGDPMYGARRLAGDPPRQALHAMHLRLRHPADGTPMQWRSPLPADMQALLEALRRGEARAAAMAPSA